MRYQTVSTLEELNAIFFAAGISASRWDHAHKEEDDLHVHPIISCTYPVTEVGSHHVRFSLHRS